MKKSWITYIATMIMVFIITFVISLLTEGGENQERIAATGKILLALGFIVFVSTVKGVRGVRLAMLLLTILVTIAMAISLDRAIALAWLGASITVVAGTQLAIALGFLEKEGAIRIKTIICLIIAISVNFAIIYFVPVIF